MRMSSRSLNNSIKLIDGEATAPPATRYLTGPQQLSSHTAAPPALDPEPRS